MQVVTDRHVALQLKRQRVADAGAKLRFQHRPEIALSWSGLASLWQRGIKLRQRIKIGGVNRRVLGRVQRLKKCFADKMDHIVTLLRGHPGLRRHVLEALGNRFVQAVGIVSVLESIHSEGPGLRIDSMYAISPMARRA